MKKVFFFIGISIILLSCSTENTNTIDSKYSYEIKRILGSKKILFDSPLPFKLKVHKEFSYAIDTLEIDLNGPTNDYMVMSCSALIDSETSATDIKPHVNYIKFINLETIWDDNKTKHISLQDEFDQHNPKFFSYSKSNINISSHPELFNDRYAGFANNEYSYTTLEIKPEIGNDIELIQTTDNYTVGEEILYDGVYYVVISKS